MTIKSFFKASSVILRVAVLLCAASASISVHAYSLLDSYHKAQQHDAQIKIAEANLAINEEIGVQAKAPLRPQVNAKYNISHSWIKTSVDGIPLVPSSESEIENDNRNFQIGLTQRLFDLEKWHTYKSTEDSNSSARAEYGAALQSLIERVSTAYFNVLKAQANLNNDLAEERALFEQRKRITLYYDNGLLSITDLFEAEAASDLSRAKRLNTENLLDIAKENLENLTGEPIENIWQLSENAPISTLEPNTKEEWAATAQKNNWSIISAQYQLDAARKNLQAKKYKRYPTVDANLAYTNTDNAGPNLSSSDSEKSRRDQKSASIDVNIPLYNGGYISSEQRKAQAQVELQSHANEQLSRDIKRESKRLFLTHKALIQQIKAQKLALESAQSAVKTTKFGFDNGIRNTTDVLRAQSALYNAKRNYDNIRYDFVSTQLALKNITGTLTEKDIVEINNWLLPSGEKNTSLEKQSSSKKVKEKNKSKKESYILKPLSESIKTNKK